MQPTIYGLFIGAGILLAGAARAQSASTDSLATTGSLRRHYSAAVGSDSRLYNGPEYVNYVKRFVTGHQYFETNQLRPATVEYAGSTYADVPLRYDIVQDELVLNAPKGILEMLLIKDKVTRFTVAGHSFIHLTAGSAEALPERPGFYELLVDGPVQLLALRRKDLQERASAGGLEGEITEKDAFFLRQNNLYSKASKAQSVLALLPEHKAALRDYIRAQKLKFNAAAREESLVALVRYAATLAPPRSRSAGAGYLLYLLTIIRLCMKYLYRLILLIGLSTVGFKSYGQTAEPAVSGSFQGVSLEQFVRQLEDQTRYRFFFDTAAVQRVTVTLQAQAQPLSSVLQQALGATELRFVIDEEHNVFITPRQPVATELPTDYFRPGAVAAAPTGDTPATSQPVRAANVARLYEIGRPGAANSAGKATLAGHIREARSGEPVPGASVYIETPAIGVSTDQFGYYALTLPVGRHTLNIRGIGIKNTRRQVQLNADGKLDVEVEEDITNLKEVVIEAEKDKNVAGMQMGMEKLDIKTIRQVPTAFGEADILRVVLTLPGVKAIGEGSTGLSVRGGSTDQNLILFNDATVYNPSHLFGFFSAFNPDILKTVELYKSGIPARFGGRLSSVLDIATRDGNKKKLSGSGGIGALTSRLTLEGPIIKDKSSFLIGGRTSYSDWLLKLLPNRDLKESSASFYDLSAHVSHELNDKNTLYATGYYSRDRFKLASDTSYAYQNQNGSLKWKHIFGNKLYGVLTGTYTNYQYRIASEKNAVNASELTFGIRQLGAQADFSYFHNTKHTIDFGPVRCATAWLRASW
ncbi:TonB-dependent receptor [Hymenobacter cellulosilyticus]|uniref:TonB-dependent receptor n=1 Tax=Hymenobacter cellulosilyticus TaxID=2932248 RepID=UPI002880AB17|nr:carboxypeptidase-like regulatory domain-containing protein [Hymenobacter cellulosilyticus]